MLRQAKPFKTTLAALAAVAALLVYEPSRAAEEFEQHGVHEHGHVVLNVALEGDTLVLEWSAPADQVLGFEHAPRTAAERERLAAATQWITRGTDVLGLPPAAGCRVRTVAHTPPALQNSAHVDYRARHVLVCAKPMALAWVEPWLLRKLQNVEHVEVNIVAPGVQRQNTVRRADERIALR